MDRRVLLVEDEPNIVEALGYLLASDGWSVLTHAEGATAAARVRADRPDLVILDVMLPGCSGFDILRELRSDPGTARTPVLILTARGQTRDRELAERLGASDFLAKPFSNAEILARVRVLAGG